MGKVTDHQDSYMLKNLVNHKASSHHGDTIEVKKLLDYCMRQVYSRNISQLV